MAIVPAALQPYDSATGTPFGQINLTLDNESRQILSASGAINGQPIDGLSNYLNASNTVIETNGRFIISGRQFYYNFGDASFSAGGVQYNFKGTPDGRPGAPIATTLTRSDGVQQNAGIYSPEFSQNNICFVSGTLIETTRGPVVVEALMPGDIALTASGGRRPIVWTGHRTVEAQPIRISAGAFGAGLPWRDLYLSPGHPVLVGADENNEGGALVPIMCLENGTSIARTIPAPVTYWHVELDVHDVLLAEGLPAESYIDGGDRAFFAEASDHALHNPDFVPPGWDARCRPVAIDGPLVEAERIRLNAVFAASLDRHSAWPAGELAL